MIKFDEHEREEELAHLREEEEEDLARILSKKYDIPYTDLTMTAISPEGLLLLPEERSRQAELAIFSRVGKRIGVAVRSPNNPKTLEVLDELKRKNYEARLFMVSNRSLEFAWSRYEDLSHTTVTERGSFDVSESVLKDITAKVRSLGDAVSYIEDIMKQGRSYQTSHIVEAIMGAGIAIGSSDVHLEPKAEMVRLRYRLDGILTDVSNIDHDTYRLLLSRIKILSGLKLNVKNEAQDGRFSITLEKTEIEIRTSIIPGEYGESIVMRILNPAATKVGLEKLGIPEKLLGIIKREISKPNGMVLTTGPTGSGKTTALYSFLRYVHDPEVKIITIENPIEYHLDGIVQTQISNKESYTFASGLRAAMRQDPDVLMVGEIRDKETAETAINAALTGHIVFSTLHTNNAAGTYPRLIGMGINPKIITSSLSLALAQRLIRRLCEHCKEQTPMADKEKNTITPILESIVDKNELKDVQREYVWHAHEGGCEHCDGVGYAGRIGIFEGIMSDQAIDTIIRTNPGEREIWETAKQQGILSMQQDGVLKVLRGITSLSELERVVDLSVAYGSR